MLARYRRTTTPWTLPRTRPTDYIVNFAVNLSDVVHGKVDGIVNPGVVDGKVYGVVWWTEIEEGRRLPTKTWSLSATGRRKLRLTCVPGMARSLRSESLRARYRRSRREAEGQLRHREVGWGGSPRRKHGAMNKNRIWGVVHSGPAGTWLAKSSIL